MKLTALATIFGVASCWFAANTEGNDGNSVSVGGLVSPSTIGATPIGTFVYIDRAVEKIFVNTDGQVQNILKGGIFVNVTSEGLCVVQSKVRRSLPVFADVDFTHLPPNVFR